MTINPKRIGLMAFDRTCAELAALARDLAPRAASTGHPGTLSPNLAFVAINGYWEAKYGRAIMNVPWNMRADIPEIAADLKEMNYLNRPVLVTRRTSRLSGFVA